MNLLAINKELKSLKLAMTLLLVLISFLVPRSSQAFSVPIDVLVDAPKAFNMAEPDYSSRLGSAVIASNSIEVQTADWRERNRKTVRKKIPTLDNPLVLEGEASYYSRAGCLGCNPLLVMANGQTLDDSKLTMAIGADRSHLVGYRAKVTSLATGLSADVLITDTGGFYQEKYGNRVADLTIATKQAIGMRSGVGPVRVEIY